MPECSLNALSTSPAGEHRLGNRQVANVEAVNALSEGREAFELVSSTAFATVNVENVKLLEAVLRQPGCAARHRLQRDDFFDDCCGSHVISPSFLWVERRLARRLVLWQDGQDCILKTMTANNLPGQCTCLRECTIRGCSKPDLF